MLAAVREKIIEPFFKTKEVDMGTGLGLSISYSIIKECRVDIQATAKMPREPAQDGHGFLFYAKERDLQWENVDAVDFAKEVVGMVVAKIWALAMLGALHRPPDYGTAWRPYRSQLVPRTGKPIHDAVAIERIATRSL
ncbi:MAG: hypothetical protein KJP07_18340 [Desulfatitalea sp.]|nr:hypothetical protein [Desulfatitalea sp.]